MSRKTPGRLVEVKADGRKGIIYNNEVMINGKYAVHLLGKDFRPTGANVLKSANQIKVIGYTD